LTQIPGISGFAGYFPAPSVDLSDWAQWTGNNVEKLHAVVGRSFRMCPSDENVYTMAAEAVLALIESYDVDTSRVGFLGLGTESSTDNSAGAIIVKGLLDDALRQRGQPPISRRCEVPEFKHACLGGIYALKSAIRFLQTDGANDVAIVVAADIAVYEPGSSGEQTQGAGAIAMLVESAPKLLEIDLLSSSRASSFRHADFRKPLNQDRPASDFHYPVFNGKFSTMCYIESVTAAAADFFDRSELSPVDTLEQFQAIFLHRPYQRMADTGKAFLTLAALSKQDDDRFLQLAGEAGVDADKAKAELKGSLDLTALLLAGESIDDVFVNCQKLVRALRGNNTYRHLIENPGGDVMQSLGNLYTASLPAWLAAGVQEMAESSSTLVSNDVLAVGYGSGDATEMLPMRLVQEWEVAASRINLAQAMGDPHRLSQDEYQALQKDDYARESHRSGGFRLEASGRPGRFGVEDYSFTERLTDQAKRV
jgi:hydroxymethylglutaryl-CoA synthase